MSHATTADFPIATAHLDKVFYPRSDFTKGDLLAYYQEVSTAMLPHLERRPVSVRRCPDGVEGKSFYEKRCPAGAPRFVRTAQIASATHGAIRFCTVDNLSTLLWLANRAAVEFHPYLYRAGAEDAPHMLVFDLDPGEGAGMGDCLRTAQELRAAIAQMGLAAFAKTSGGKGLHLAVPIRDASFADIKDFAYTIAKSLESRHPDRLTTRMAKAERRGRVFIDWSQNDHGKTTVAAYSLRVQPEPTVSTPVSWEEIERASHQRTPRLSFTAVEVRSRLERFGDIFAEVLTHRQRLPSGWK